MQPVRIFSPTFDNLGEILRYISLQFIRSWSDIGAFELHVSRYTKYADKLQKMNLIVLGDQLNKCGIILHREIELDENGKATENWIIKGFMLKSIASFRLTVPSSTTGYDNKSGSAETVMKHYIDTQMVNPTNPDRKIPNLIIAPDQGRGTHVDWQSRYASLSDELTMISNNTGLGWDITLDPVNKQWVFDCYAGLDRSYSQSANKRAIFDPDFHSVKSQHFVDSDLSLKNFAYVGGQGEDVNRQIVTVGSATGLSRHETFVDARDVDGTGSVTLVQRGQQALDEAGTELYLEGDILLKSPFVYGTDYDVGDIVTIQNKGWGYTVDERITAMQETYESTGLTLSATFGQKVPTLITRIKKELSQFYPELRR
jgi:hypothetical protein